MYAIIVSLIMYLQCVSLANGKIVSGVFKSNATRENNGQNITTFLFHEAAAGMDNHTFLYFAYGSNLLKERLQLKNPSATVHCVARLKDYKLAFGNHQGLPSARWQGGVATIEHSLGDEVWGVVWKMNVTDLESLDRQENVKMGTYSPVEVSVSTTAQELSCRTYIMNNCVYALPSPHYLKVIVMGAEQNGLPRDYQEKLKAIETNRYNGTLAVMEELDRALNKSQTISLTQTPPHSTKSR